MCMYFATTPDSGGSKGGGGGGATAAPLKLDQLYAFLNH